MTNMRTTTKVFIDTSAFVSLVDDADPNHKKAVTLAEYVFENDFIPYTSSDIVGESFTVISKKLGKSKAFDFDKKYFHGVINEIFCDEFIHKETRGFFFRVKSKNVSFIDCSSIVAMKNSKISVAFSFDEHFKSMGVKLLGDVV